jgi:16S rRNA (cytosine967-C5)-methyltransferase
LGTLRRNPELKWRVSKADIKTKKKNQLCILVKAALFCKVGGYLVYATCSTIYEENEAVVREFLSNSDEFHRCDNNLALEKQNIFLDNTWNVFDSYGNIQLWSDLTGTDSFFMTRLIRIK